MSVTSIPIKDDFESSLEAERLQDTLEALDDVKMGRVVEGEKVSAWLESWGTEKELTAPSK